MLKGTFIYFKLVSKDYKVVTTGTGIIVPEDLQFCKYPKSRCNQKKSPALYLGQ
jgi:hypothetical protein